MCELGGNNPNRKGSKSQFGSHLTRNIARWFDDLKSVTYRDSRSGYPPGKLALSEE